MDGMELIRMDLELAAPILNEDGLEVLEGHAQLTRWSAKGGRQIRGKTDLGRHAVSLVHGVHSATFVLQPTMGRHFRGTRLQPMNGVVDTAHHRLAGIQGEQLTTLTQWFRLQRPEEFEGVAKAFERFAGKGPTVRRNDPTGRGRGTQALASLFGGGPDKPKAETVTNWARGMDQERPREAWQGAREGALRARSMILFEDEHFSQAFGAPFDDLSNSKVDGIYALLRQDFQASRVPEEKQLAGLARVFHRSDEGSPTGTQTLQAVLSMRTFRQWLRAQKQRLESMPVGEEGWGLVAGMQYQLDARLEGMLWPSELTELRESVEAGRTVQTYAYIQRQFDELEQRPRDKDTLRVLMDFPFRKREEMAGAPRAQYIELEERRFGLMDRIVEELLPDTPVARQVAGDADSALDVYLEGGVLFRTLRSELARVWELPSTLEFRESFQAARARLLPRALPEMKQRILTLKLKDLASVEGAWFPLRQDRESAAHREALAALEARDATIQAAIGAGASRALELAKGDPKAALRFLDLRGFPAQDFLEAVYYGETDGIVVSELLTALDRGDATEMLKQTNLSQNLRTAFRIYHHLYYKRFGRTESMRNSRRESHGDDWRGIYTVTTTTNRFGPVGQPVKGPVHTYVRREYAKKYNECEISEGELFGSLFLGLAAERQDPAGSQAQGIEALELTGLGFLLGEGAPRPERAAGSLLADRDEYHRGFGAFLDAFEKDHLPTLRHLEHNLLAMVSSRPMRKIQRLDVDGL